MTIPTYKTGKAEKKPIFLEKEHIRGHRERYIPTPGKEGKAMKYLAEVEKLDINHIGIMQFKSMTEKI